MKLLVKLLKYFGLQEKIMGKLSVNILRGIPGSGKSYYANKAVEVAESMNDYATICSADSFFMINGEYCFDPTKISKAHQECYMKAHQSISLGRKIINFLDKNMTVIIDNTNTQNWEISPYILMAQSYGAEIHIIKFEVNLEVALERNIHKVPEDIIKSMIKLWEDPFPFWPEEVLYEDIKGCIGE